MEAVSHFHNVYKQNCTSNLIKQLKVLNSYLRLFTPEEEVNVGKRIDLTKIQEVLKFFAKDKSQGPDDWTMKIFFHFFELMGEDIHKATEES